MFKGILVDKALEYGWKVIQVPDVNQHAGHPEFKAMFQTAMNISGHSIFHGFSNGDILFTQGNDFTSYIRLGP